MASILGAPKKIRSRATASHGHIPHTALLANLQCARAGSENREAPLPEAEKVLPRPFWKRAHASFPARRRGTIRGRSGFVRNAQPTHTKIRVKWGFPRRGAVLQVRVGRYRIRGVTHGACRPRTARNAEARHKGRAANIHIGAGKLDLANDLSSTLSKNAGHQRLTRL